MAEESWTKLGGMDDRAEVYLNGYLIDKDPLDHQAMYWNRPNTIFSDDFDDGEVITIDESRRCTEYILQGAVEIVNKCSTYFPKKLTSVRGEGNKINILVSRNHEVEADWISNKIIELNDEFNISYNEMAIITKQLNRAEELFRILNRKGLRANYWRPNQIFRDSIVRNIICFFRLFKHKLIVFLFYLSF